MYSTLDPQTVVDPPDVSVPLGLIAPLNPPTIPLPFFELNARALLFFDLDASSSVLSSSPSSSSSSLSSSLSSSSSPPKWMLGKLVLRD